jgi:predicted DNA-binding transcriptional regulator YafY
MDRTERFYKIEQLLRDRVLVTREAFLEALEVSPATFKRDIEYLRDRYGAPLVWDRERSGYRYDLTQPGAERFELPGFWLSASEIHALLAMQALLSDLDEGLLADQVKPLMARLEGVLEGSRLPTAEVRKRMRILHQGARRTEPAAFGVIAQALLARKRVGIRHHNRASNEDTTREISPQRLVHYRDNWYLDAWCHDTRKIKTFAVERVHEARVSRLPAREVTDAELDRIFRGGYGIFSGAPVGIAELIFTAERAEWVASEKWHSEQRGEHLEDGRYRLRVPYSDIRELTMDILKYGAEVEVVAPEALRQHVAEQLRKALETYQSP